MISGYANLGGIWMTNTPRLIYAYIHSPQIREEKVTLGSNHPPTTTTTTIENRKRPCPALV